MADYHWIGSTAGNINSFRWGDVSNWRVTQLGTPGSTAPGGTLARLVPATRLPLGNIDKVYIGPGNALSPIATPYLPARYNIQSPCLFGGVTTAANRVWEGSTAGTSVQHRYGQIEMVVSPRYPFSRLGGYVDAQILNEWKDYTNALHGTAFAGWTLASGEEYDNAQYITIGSGGTLGSWHGQQAGTTAGISFAQQTSYAIRGRGSVTSAAHARTTVTIAGFTGASAGAAGSGFDGTNNRINLKIFTGYPYGNSGNRLGEGFTGQAFLTNMAPEVVYDSGAVVCSGHWNEVRSTEMATRKGDISLDGAFVNALTLKPTSNWSYSAIPGGNIVPQQTQITSPATSAFELGNVYINETSSLRFVQIGNVKRHSAEAEVTVLGDITPAGGFVCAVPAGPSAGASGGVFYPNGSLVVESPAENATADTDGARVNLGFAQYDGSTKATTEITSVHVLQNTAVPMTVVLTGPLTSETVNLHGGTLKKGDDLQETAPVNIDALNLHGNAVYDISSNPKHRAGAVTVLGQSSAASVKLGDGTSLIAGHVNQA